MKIKFNVIKNYSHFKIRYYNNTKSDYNINANNENVQIYNNINNIKFKRNS